MKRKITVSIEADITLEMTKEEEKIIDDLRHAEDDDDWDRYSKLENKLEKLLLDRISKEIKNLKDTRILDTNW